MAHSQEADARLAANQAQVDAFLPTFLKGDPARPPRGDRWVALADLSFQLGDERGIGSLIDLAPSVDPGGWEVLPRRSTLRLVDTFWDMWGGGYIAGIFFDFAVEDGPLAERTLTVCDYVRLSWANGVPRRTLAAALLVPAGDPTIGDAEAARTRYERLVAIMGSGIISRRADVAEGYRRHAHAFGGPLKPPGLDHEPVALATDLAALGLPPARV